MAPARIQVSDEEVEDDPDFRVRSDPASRIAKLKRTIANLSTENEELRDALRDSQLKVSEFATQNEELLTTVETIQSAEEAAGNKRRKSAPGLPAAIAKESDLAVLLGKKYGVMMCPWVSIISLNFQGRPDIDLHNQSRFSSALKDQAVAAELYDFLPANLPPLVKEFPKLADRFKFGVNAVRSGVAHNIRKCAGQIFNLPSDIFAMGADRRGNGEVQVLLGWDEKSSTYSRSPPILYPYGRSGDSRVFLRSLILVKIQKVVLFGPSSLSANAARGKPKTNAIIWGVNSVSDGSIAFAAILARYLLSPDMEFSEKGTESQITYYHDFWYYRKFLCIADSEARQQLFDWYNRQIFTKRREANASGPAIEDEDGDEDEALARAVFAFNMGANDEQPDLDTPAPSPVPSSTPSRSSSISRTDVELPSRVAAARIPSPEPAGVNGRSSPEDVDVPDAQSSRAPPSAAPKPRAAVSKATTRRARNDPVDAEKTGEIAVRMSRRKGGKTIKSAATIENEDGDA